MDIEVLKGEDGQFRGRFVKPHKLKELNIFQLRKAYKRTLRVSPELAKEVENELKRRLNRKKGRQEVK